MTLVSRLLPESAFSSNWMSRARSACSSMPASSRELPGAVCERCFRQPVRPGKVGLHRARHGIAVPHGRLKGLKDAVGAFVRTRQPIPFEAPDGNPVSLVFILLVPEKATDVHLQILSELAEMFSDRALRQQLMDAPDAIAVQKLITTWDPHAPAQHRAAV